MYVYIHMYIIYVYNIYTHTYTHVCTIYIYIYIYIKYSLIPFNRYQKPKKIFQHYSFFHYIFKRHKSQISCGKL